MNDKITVNLRVNSMDIAWGIACGLIFASMFQVGKKVVVEYVEKEKKD